MTTHTPPDRIKISKRASDFIRNAYHEAVRELGSDDIVISVYEFKRGGRQYPGQERIIEQKGGVFIGVHHSSDVQVRDIKDVEGIPVVFYFPSKEGNMDLKLDVRGSDLVVK